MSNAIKINNISKVIKDYKILDNVSLEVEKGKIYGFLGANGAGKTSLLKIILGLYKATDGEVELFDQKMEKGNREVYKKISSIIEEPIFYSHLNVRKNLEIHCDYMKINYSRVDEILELVGLDKHAEKLVKELSLGMRQRLAIGRTLIASPDLLLLDEPINGLDPHGIKEFRTIIKEVNDKCGTTMLISSHILDEVAKIADTVIIIHKGKVVSQVQMSDIGTNLGNLETYYFDLLKEVN